MSLTVIVLAAGAGTRMHSATPKVLHRIGGASLLGHVLSAARATSPDRLVVVVGAGREQVGPHVAELDPGAVVAVQAEQRGTGDAVRAGLAALPGGDAAGGDAVGGDAAGGDAAGGNGAGANGDGGDGYGGGDGEPAAGTVVVLSGDTPLLSAASLTGLVAARETAGAAVAVLTAVLADPAGYGRVVRDAAGTVAGIVEHRDAGTDQLAVTEVNTGVWAFDAAALPGLLDALGSQNAAGEVYLTDTVAAAVAAGLGVVASVTDDPDATAGVNDRVQLAAAGAELNRRVLEGWMREGVTVVDPATTWVDVGVTLEPDSTLLPGTQLHGSTTVAAGAVVGPDTTLRDVAVGAGAVVVRTHGSGARIGAGASVGPFAFLRPGTDLGADGKIGTFVETKNVTIGAGSKVPHLTYAGDAAIGVGTNIGASSVFVNYDGVGKHRTTIGDHCRTGSDTMFVAPVSVGDGAYTGAGTVVRRDVPPGALAVNVAPQRNLEGWVARNRPGTPAAAAAGRDRSTAPDGATGQPGRSDGPAGAPERSDGAAPSGDAGTEDAATG